MLYKFKSQATGDVIMLEVPGRQVLQALGKDADPKGILTVAQMPHALKLLEAASAADDQARAQSKADGIPVESISLRTRSQPLVAMVQRALKAEQPVTWGV